VALPLHLPHETFERLTTPPGVTLPLAPAGLLYREAAGFPGNRCDRKPNHARSNKRRVYRGPNACVYSLLIPGPGQTSQRLLPMSDINIFPVFPHTIALSTLNESEVDGNALDYVQDLEYVETAFDESHSTSRSSSNFDVLDHLPLLKKGILDRFYVLKNQYLFHTRNDFVITTSWSTRSEKGGYSKFHNHRNCYYSGVYYFDGDENTGKIRFNNPFRSAIWVESTRLNELNMSQFGVSPQKNMVVFFPSYMEHAIQEHKSDTIRYSIAFNLMPVGRLGAEDSAAVIEVPSSKDRQ
jgi:uncharacterized protein (TIGR02466 family)